MYSKSPQHGGKLVQLHSAPTATRSPKVSFSVGSQSWRDVPVIIYFALQVTNKCNYSK